MELPAELWQIIQSYVEDPDERRRLCGVNRALFNIILDETYHDARIHYLANHETARLFRALDFCRPQIVHRVRNLVLRPHALNPTNSTEALTLLRSLPKFTNLTSLDLHCCFGDNYTHFVGKALFIQPALKIYARTLTTLRLRIPLEAYKPLGLSSIHFTTLQHLTLHIFKEYSSTNARGVLSNTIPDLINNHEDTLQELIVDIPLLETKEFGTVSTMFNSFNQLPHLTSFYLTALLQPGDGKCISEAVRAFLEKHKYHLRSFCLSVEHCGRSPEAGNDMLLPSFAPSFSHLTSITLNLSSNFLGGTDVIIDFLQQHSNSLQHMSLKGRLLSFHEVEDILLLLDGVPLQSLELNIARCGPDLFILLSSKLPQLKTLYLGFDLWTGGGRNDNPIDIVHKGPITDPTKWHSNAFCNAILSMTYLFLDWGLQHLTYDVFQHSDFNAQWCHRALAIALPNIITVNGIEREDLVINPNKLKRLLWKGPSNSSVSSLWSSSTESSQHNHWQ